MLLTCSIHGLSQARACSLLGCRKSSQAPSSGASPGPKPYNGCTQELRAAEGSAQQEHPWIPGHAELPQDPAQTNAPHKVFYCTSRTASEVFSRGIPKVCSATGSKILLLRKGKPDPEGRGGGSPRARCREPERGIPRCSMCCVLIRVGPGAPWRVTGMARASLFLRAVKGASARGDGAGLRIAGR